MPHAVALLIAILVLGGCVRPPATDPACSCTCDAGLRDATSPDGPQRDGPSQDQPQPDRQPDAQKDHFLRFKADGDYARLDKPMDWSKDFSVSLELRLTQIPGDARDYLTCFAWDEVTETLSGWELGFNEGGQRWFVVSQDVKPWPKQCERHATQVFPIQSWRLVTFVFDYTQPTTVKQRIYLDGNLLVDVASPGKGCTTDMSAPLPPAAFRIGAMDTVQLDADNLRVWHRALSEVEAASLANGVIPPGVILHWNMNEGSGTALWDASGNGHTGTLSGSAWIAR